MAHGMPDLEDVIRVVTDQGAPSPTHSQQATQYVFSLPMRANTLLPTTFFLTRFIEQVKASPNRWNVGLQLLYAARNEVTQFFGLLLIRDWLTDYRIASGRYYYTRDAAKLAIYNAIRSYHCS